MRRVSASSGGASLIGAKTANDGSTYRSCSKRDRDKRNWIEVSCIYDSVGIRILEPLGENKLLECRMSEGNPCFVLEIGCDEIILY
jgi:hypothetical protein